MPNPKNPNWYMGATGGGAMWPGAGDIYYCNGISGSNANDGLTPNAPKLTLTAALALCVNDHDDYIIVQDYWQPAGEVWPIHVNKSKVHIIGVKSGNNFRQWTAMHPPADTAVLSIEADNVRVENLALWAGASHGGIEFVSGVGDGIFNCMFMSSLYGIYAEVNTVAWGLEIAGCYFTSLTGQCIYLDNPATSWIHDNMFNEAVGCAIEVIRPGGMNITNNIIGLAANTAGLAITLGAGTTNALVSGNVANFGDTDMGNNPFLDNAVAGTNNWMNNMLGITLIQPG